MITFSQLLENLANPKRITDNPNAPRYNFEQAEKIINGIVNPPINCALYPDDKQPLPVDALDDNPKKEN